jgi:MFS family permease
MSYPSQSYVAASSSQLERDVRQLSTRTQVDPGKIALGVIIGRTAEFFDFFTYCIAAVIVFPRLLFPTDDPVTGTLYSFAIFSLAFIARPAGSLLFMAVDRRYGRGAKLTVAMFLLGGSTVAIAFIPSYESAGVLGIYLLCTFRFAQGLALGGAWDGLASLLALNAPQNRKGWYAMMPQLGAPAGFIVAAALFAYFMMTLSDADFIDWGWRYAFFVAFAINVVALFARLRLVATTEFGHLLDQNELQAVRIADTFKVHGRTILLGAFLPLASYALFHLVTVFPLSWVNLYTDHSVGRFLIIQLIGAILGMGTIAASGIIADRIGRRKLLGICAVVIGLGSFAAPFLYEAGAIGEDIIVLGGFAILGLSFGQAAGALGSNFRKQYRYTGSAITSDLAWLIGAGFAPLVALFLCDRFGLIMVGAYLLSGAICTLIALYFNKQMVETQPD